MNPPLTPQPDHPLEPTATAKTTSTQLFGVLYITLTGLVDFMVPNSGPWSLLRQSHPFYGGPYLPAQLYLTLSRPRPLLTTGFLKNWVLGYSYGLAELCLTIGKNTQGLQVSGSALYLDSSDY
ncbi:hypothetical protein DSO57_1017892 [Entomophthora muscae]|uniref:Uncharacterized protein n=1 Tax=Entomophthora muscae TaxID=34485 RepID=A0ACC2UQT0_9FUNG|nr:hypothetical protein DSO57_1017892 [Entomophthora muscae]